MSVIQIEQLSYQYNDTPVLKDINLYVNQGEIVSIVGASGVGKTTLFNIIANILPLQHGKIIYGHNNTEQKVSYMLQKDLLLPHKTVIENVMLPLQLKKVDTKEAKMRSEQLLETFELSHIANFYPHELSGGMRQRVALLRTYMMGHSLFLLDEPFSALDTLTKSALHKWYIDSHKKLELTTLLITHDIDEAITLSNRVYILAGKPGEIVAKVDIQLNDDTDKDIQRLMYKKDILNQLNW